MRISARFAWVICGVLSLGISQAHAGRDAGRLHPDDLEAIDTPVFLKHHPDVQWRFEGLDELEKGNTRIAFRHFVHAAEYGDKLSQAMVAEMYWKGRGTSRDRALAYAWMDLAAERLYEPLLVKREQYWAALSEKERARALEAGQGIYAEYGDDVALPRLKQLFDRGKRGMTGSRLGSQIGTRSIYPGSGSSSVQLNMNCGFGGPGEIRQCMGFSASGDGKHIDRLWDRQFWNVREYVSWKETTLDYDLAGGGRVEVSPMEVVER